jgi:drug/metabolite transporter (DMT)-like permease
VIPAPLLALGAAFFFGVAAVVLRRALQYGTPITATVLSVTFTGLAVWLLAAPTQPLERALTPAILPFVLAGLVAPGLARLGLFIGVARVGVGRSMAVASSAPLVAVGLAILFLGERPSRWLLLGAACVVAGGALLSYRPQADRSWRRRDMIFPLGAAFGFGVRDNISRIGLQDFEFPLLAAAIAATASCVVMWGVALVTRGSALLRASPRGLGLMATSGVVEGMAYVCMWQSLALSPVTVVSPLVNSHSIFIVVLAALFLRDLERVTWRLALASVLVVAGVGLVIRFGAA